ncbi:NTP transferase domain-containing protein [Aquipseudomonas alcaligenes]|uniref:nucleotidyltransferase family protein n=1 Tax=Aquipseudomonas alcaligenes TaxID=43263 RepID=UPI00374A925F
MTSIAGLVLAAGFATRFGSDKRRALLKNGSTLLDSSLATVNVYLPSTWVVLRPSDDADTLGIAPLLNIVRSESAELGLGHSLASGIEAITRSSDADAVAIFLGDMPWIAGDSLEQLFAVAASDRIVQPVYDGQPGHPVVFGRQFWPELLQLCGDEGARSVLQAHPEAVRRIKVDDPGVIQDVDTPDALR